MMEMRALFLDVDGTLLAPDGTLNTVTKEAVSQLRNQGVKVFLATGRPYEGTVALHKELGLMTPMICLNGAGVYSPSSIIPAASRSIKINPNAVRGFANTQTDNVMIHTTKGLYCRKIDDEIRTWTESSGISPLGVGPIDQLPDEPILKYSFRTKQGMSPLAEPYGYGNKVIQWQDGFEILAPHVSKWSMIRSVLHAYGIRRSETVAIGDGPNDVEMLRFAGTGVAMGNAAEKIKEAADTVTLSNAENGAAAYMTSRLVRSRVV
ncbi:HAD family hydrolase [Salisediminibacterium halotolerans]|uniref:HAD family hydrolase n=1 Tax=Salisediminibacterium halotolerans TaxID=517425 RepID=UPI000EB0CB31|nr:Cof-type HAD-IIB family hydrolase [Salisediminibacterium halotolerans]RLJ71691.1 hypothetical protein BCL39_2362 [Actinophytocola xinjiangensis]RPE86841.1 hypothetical protein EDD67_1703 [Salisediminibacterium halotolerans]TWG32904.1 hypothetical protein BCL52_2357 [Salisediminibacterium halotolerans]GEL07758.1 hydrolase [Salisediminibacterium halotolerans]